MAAHLIGFGDFPEAYVEHIGVVARSPRKPGATIPTKPVKGPVAVKHAATSGKPSPHKAAMVNVINAGKNAVAKGKKATVSAASYKPKDHAPLVKLAASVAPSGKVMLGAVTARPLTAKQHAAVAKHASAIARHAAANKALNIAASKATKAGNDAIKFAKVATPFLKKALSASTGIPAKATSAAMMLGAMAAVLGTDASGLEPGMPGYDPSTDPNAQGYGGYPPAPGGYDPSMDPSTYGAMPTAGGVDASTGIVTGPDGSVLYDPSQDPALVPMPVRGGTLSPSDAQIQWANVPADGVPYDGSKGFPDQSVGSYNTQYNHQDGYEMHADGWYLKKGSDYDHSGPSAPNYGNDQGWGPLVGNPGGPLANIQWAVADKKWFWQSANAPTWATTEIDSKIALANQNTVAANIATAVAQLAQMQKDAAANAEAQAKQQAQIALQQTADQAAEAHATSQATAADTVAQQQQGAQQAQQDIVYQTQQDAQQAAEAQANLDMLKQEAPIAAQEDQISADAQKEELHQLVVEAAAHNEWMQQHPEEAEAAYQAAHGAPQDDGGGGGGPDDEASSPFGDGQPGVQEAPSMFEENQLPEAGDAPPNWPHDDDEV